MTHLFYATPGSFLVSDNLQFSGDKTAFFYPDCRTALVGTFDKDGQMLKGQATEDALIFSPIFMAPDPEVLCSDLPLN